MKLVKNIPEYWEFIREVRNNYIIQKGFVEEVYITTRQQIEYMGRYNDCYYICLHKKDPIGFIGEINGDIRLAVIVEYQRLGVGRFMLNEFMKLRPNSCAKIKLNNIASIKLFESCGFIYQGKDEQFYYFKR